MLVFHLFFPFLIKSSHIKKRKEVYTGRYDSILILNQSESEVFQLLEMTSLDNTLLTEFILLLQF